jgi:ELWxxDGT repeat protein
MKLIYSLILFFFVIGVHSQVTQVTDINPGIFDSGPANLVSFNNNLFFTADDGTAGNGNRLYRYNPVTDISTLLPVVSSTGNAATRVTLYDTIEYNGELYLSLADNNLAGRLFFRYDTATDALVLIPGVQVKDMAIYNNFLFMNAETDPSEGYELHYYDSANNLATLVTDINPGSGDSNATEFTILNNKLYFAANGNSFIGRELYEYDLVTDLTRLVENINTRTSGTGRDSNPSFLTVFNNELYFSAFDLNVGAELFKYDPVLDDVVVAADVCAGCTLNLSGVIYLFLHNDKFYFRATGDPDNGEELYSYDPINDTTALVRDLNAGLRQSSSPQNFFSFNNRLYFTARGSNGGAFALYVYNDVTDIMTELAPMGFTSFFLDDKIEFNNKLYLGGRTDNSVVSQELYVYDDVALTLVQDIYPGFSRSEPQEFTICNNEIYFSAQNATSGVELFKYNPATASLNNIEKNIRVQHYQGQIHIESDGSKVTTQVYDLLGQQVLNSEDMIISTDHLKDGIYIAIFHKGHDTETLKFIQN